MVISLIRSQDRREVIASRLRELNLDFEFIDAVDGKELNTATIQVIQNAQRATRDYGRTIGATEIACAMSHTKAYESLLASDAAGSIILEDDAIIDPKFKGFVAWLLNAEAITRGLWLLGGGEYVEKQVVKNYFDFAICAHQASAEGKNWGKVYQITKCFDHLARACGYFIDRQTAQTLLQNNAPPVALADDWPYFIQQGWISPYLCKPYLIKHPLIINNQSLLQAERSTTTATASKNPKLSSRLKSAIGYYRIAYRFKVALHKLKHG